MADPLRRSLLARLRGKKTRRGAAGGGRQGNGKLSHMQRERDGGPPGSDAPGPELPRPDAPGPGAPGPDVPEPGAPADRTSTYENCVDGLPARRGRDGERPPGAPLHRGGSAGRRGPGRGHFVSVSRCVGDSIGFGDSDRVLPRAGAAARWTPDPRHAAGHLLRTPEAPEAPHSTEESILIRNLEILGPELGEPRGLQSPTFFPTELEICDPGESSPPNPSDSGDEDYYDNEILAFYESRPADVGRERADVRGEGPRGDSAQETDRLRNQLKEAYYLLINAMNDIGPDAQQAGGGPGARPEASSCSSPSGDSSCSRLSARNVDSDSWSSGGERSPRRGSDGDSLLLLLSGNLEADPDRGPNSRSVENLRASEPEPALPRSASDGAFRYPGEPSPCRPAPGEGGASEAAGSGSGPRGPGSASGSEETLQEGRGAAPDGSGGSASSLTGSSDSGAERRAPDLGQEPGGPRASGAVLKGHGVTVNKMQEWMHKGRLLSSEMKQRIEGSSSRSGDRAAPQGPHLKKDTSPTIKPPPQQQQQQQQQQQPQPAFIENVQSREAGRANELSAWRPHLNTITVSKKRNWLQQSSLGKNHCAKDEPPGTPGAEEEGCQSSRQTPPPPSPSPERLRAGAPLRPVCLLLPQVSIGPAKMSPRPRSTDPAEENDADDEGEIWYNPIPEDDEPEASHGPSVRLRVPPRAEPQRRPCREGDGGHGGRSPEGCGDAGPTAAESFASNGVSGDGGQGNAHSTEAFHLHRQMPAGKAQEEAGPSGTRSTDVPDLPNAVGFSPPSSPNPSKKSGSINWSFPDKIKSPRTVRKISMKMKKLPELSRKLSVKGAQSSCNSGGGGHLEPRAHSFRTNGSGSEGISQTSGPQRLAASGGGQASRNVISRYHLDSSVSTQHSFNKKKNSGGSKSASKGGYLSDGDSPELVAKSGKHGPAEGKGGKAKEAEGGVGTSKLNGTELDIDAFRHYSFTEQPKCSQYISGLMSLHFYGAEDLKPPRVDSRDVYCAIQVDSVNKARTALLTCRTTFLDMDHTFNIELENAQHLKLVVFSWEPTPRRNRVCCHGTVVLPALFRVIRSHQLAVKLEPRGLIYVKLGLMEQWQNSLDGGPDGDREPQVFGLEAWRVVEKENSGLMVPLLISKCIHEIEKRGCQVVGLYRLCGSAAVKKELREAFERDSHAVELSENTYPDINVITGVLKDYLRELPYPLITKQLYEAVLESMAGRPLRMGASGCENDQADSEHTVGLLDILPDVERMTLRKLLNHLKLVASHQEANKMTCQNLAVCFGPVLLSQRQEASCHTNRVFVDSEELASALHFKKHIEVLHYLLQLWPVVDPHGQSSSQTFSADLPSAPPLRRRKERPQVLNLTEAEMAGVLRPKAGRLDSPSNRYAGDWSCCGDNFSSDLPPPGRDEADYDDVPSEEAEASRPEEVEEEEGGKPPSVTCPASELVQVPQEEREQQQQKKDQREEEVEEEATQEERDDSSDRQQLEEEEEEREEERVCDHILPPRLPKEHAYQAYMKIQDISPVLSNRVNLRDLQESIDTLIGNLERELNKNKLNVGY